MAKWPKSFYTQSRVLYIETRAVHDEFCSGNRERRKEERFFFFLDRNRRIVELKQHNNGGQNDLRLYLKKCKIIILYIKDGKIPEK